MVLGRWRCVNVEAIVIREGVDGKFSVAIDGVELSMGEKEALARHEGFQGNGNHGAFKAMMLSGVFLPEEKGLLNFTGHVVHWDFDQPV